MFYLYDCIKFIGLVLDTIIFIYHGIHIPSPFVYFGLPGIILEILSCNFAFFITYIPLMSHQIEICSLKNKKLIHGFIKHENRAQIHEFYKKGK